MGLIQSCLGKRSTKVGVMSEAEADAYKKMEEEVKKEEVDDNIQNKPLPRLMFAAKPNNHKAGPDEADSSTIKEVVEKKGGVAFNIEYKSSVPKLPPINLTKARAPRGEDYEKWKEERNNLIDEKNEQAKMFKILHFSNSLQIAGVLHGTQVTTIDKWARRCERGLLCKV